MGYGRLCCVEGCPNNSDKIRDKRYVYRFPKEQDQLELWLNNITNPVPNIETRRDSIGVCSRHWPRNAKFKIIRKNKRPLDPPSVFDGYDKRLIYNKSEGKSKVKESTKTPSPKKAEFVRRKSASSGSEAKKKGPYSLRKGKMKNYDLMMKGMEVLDGFHSFSPVKKNERARPSTSTSNQKAEVNDEEASESSSPERKPSSVATSVMECSDFGSDIGSSPRRSPRKGANNFVVPGMFSPSNAEFIISPATSDDEPAMTNASSEKHIVNRVLTLAPSCHYCHSMFAFEQDLMEHRRSNKCMSLTERRFTCNECQVEFPRRIDLEKHVGNHTSWGMAHLCVVCKQKVSWKNLHAHLKKHRASIEVS